MANIVKNRQFQTDGDWVNGVISQHCTDKVAVRDGEDWRVTGNKISVEKLSALAAENGFKSHLHAKANLGLHRMVIGNGLRARARRRHGLNINGEFVQAPAEFIGDSPKTENPDGSRISCPMADGQNCTPGQTPTGRGGGSDDPWAEISILLAELYRAVGRLEELFPDRKFTPDGHLIGSIGEVVGARMFDLQLLPPSAEGHDARADDGTLVQIKLTQGNRVSFRHTEPQHLLVFRLEKHDRRIEVVYNGGGRQPWDAAGKPQRNGQRSIALSKLRKINATVAESERLPIRNKVDIGH